MAREPSTPMAVGRVLVERAVGLRRGEELVVATWNHTLPWATACVAEARRRGGRATLLLEDESAFWQSVEIAPATRTWSGMPAAVRAAVAQADALIYFAGPADRPRLRALPLTQRAPFHGADEAWVALGRRSRARVVRCLLGYASDHQGDRWGVSGTMWRSQLLRAVTDADPHRVRQNGERVARAFATGREVRITAPNGTDVTLRLRGRAPSVDDGYFDADARRRGRHVVTSPGGVVVVAIDERSAHGTAIANRPSFLSAGRVDQGQWDIEHGRLREYWYSEGTESFESEFGKAPRGREIVGLLALGLNPALAAGVPHAEDGEAGTVTLAIGGNAPYGGSNRCSYLSWLTIGEAAVAVDGQPLVDRGEIL